MGRVPTMTKLGQKKIINVRGRGNNVKRRALRVDAIVLIDATPFRQWYLKKYDVELNKKKIEESNKAREATKQSGSVKRKIAARNKDQKLEQKLADQFNGG